jgi:hypothetical protein
MSKSTNTSKARAERAPYALNFRDAVAYSGMSRTRLECFLKSGELSAVKTGRRTLVLGESLRQLIDRLPSAR